MYCPYRGTGMRIQPPTINLYTPLNKPYSLTLFLFPSLSWTFMLTEHGELEHFELLSILSQVRESSGWLLMGKWQTEK